MTATPTLRVVKVGGSLYDWPELAAALGQWLEAQPPACNVLVPGGGPLAEALRAADRIHHLGEEASHWLCIRALGVNARFLKALLPECELLTSANTPAKWPPLAVLDPEAFLRAEETARDVPPLPHRWEVTSDSIAARIAQRAGAAELVLLKSDLPGCPPDARAAARRGHVDGYFPKAVAGLPVRYVHLCADGFPEVRLVQ